MGLKALVLGGGGNLARRILERYPDFVALPKGQCDICNYPMVASVLQEMRPKYVINCAAMTNVDECEQNPAACWNVNYQAVVNLAHECTRRTIRLVHFSSDYAVNPVNVYGRAKAGSERIARHAGMVIRTNMYDAGSFILRKLLAGQPIKAFADVRFNPISTFGVIDHLFIDRNEIVNIGTALAVSMYEFALLVCGEFGIDRSLVSAVPFANTLPAKRNKDLYIKPFNHLTIEEDLSRFRHEIGK